MGRLLDHTIFQQLKKAQGETNERLDALLAGQKRTNELLAYLAEALHQSLTDRSRTTSAARVGDQAV